MTSTTLRAFLALELPPEVRAEAFRAAEELRRELANAVRWVPEENLHLTLKFLGDVDSQRVPRLVSSAAAKLARVERFEGALGGLGAFPNARAARVLWLGLTRGSAQLARLARKLDSVATRAGAERDRRPFQAHLTIGRLQEPARVAIERIPGPGSLPFPVEEVVLYESRLSAAGPTYVPLARLPLGQSEAHLNEYAPEF